MLHGISIYVMLYKNLCSVSLMSSIFLCACSGKENIIQNLRACNENSHDLPYFLDLYKNRNNMHTTSMFFDSAIKIGS
jgi:hypothetical protein